MSAVAPEVPLLPVPSRRAGWLLWVFLVAVAAAVGAGLRQRFPRPDLDGAVRQLADGDLDGAERARMLARLRELGESDARPFASWAAGLAALSLGDLDGFRAAFQRVGGVPPTQGPEPGEVEFLHLGDPLLGNVQAALQAEQRGDRELARRKWQQVQVQARMTGQALAFDSAGAALERLH